MNIGQRIQMRRKKLRLSQQQVAQGKWTRSYVSQIENNRVQPSVQTLATLAERLDITVADLIGDALTLEKAKATIFSPTLCQDYLSQLNKNATNIFLDNLTNSLLTNKMLECQLPPNAELYYLTARVLIFQKNYHQAKQILLKGLKFLDEFWRILYLTQLCHIYKILDEQKEYLSTVKELKKTMLNENPNLTHLREKIISDLTQEFDPIRSKDLLRFLHALDYGSVFQEAIRLVNIE